MRKKLIYIIITTVFCFMAYFLGINHTETTTTTLTEIPTETTSYTEPYTDTVPLDQCIPLENIACYHIDDSGFYCVVVMVDLYHFFLSLYNAF